MRRLFRWRRRLSRRTWRVRPPAKRALICRWPRDGLDAATTAPQDKTHATRERTRVPETWVDHFPSRERSAAAALEPRVSAIVVTRNAGPSLDLCIRSALVEDWIDDVVIVDAGNPEAVSSALRALQADRRDVKIITAPIGAGLA